MFIITLHAGKISPQNEKNQQISAKDSAQTFLQGSTFLGKTCPDNKSAAFEMIRVPDLPNKLGNPFFPRQILINRYVPDVGKFICLRCLNDRICRCVTHNSSSFPFILNHQNHMNKAGHTERAARPHGI